MKKLPKRIYKKLTSISLKKWSIGFTSLAVLVLLGLGSFWYVTDYNEAEKLNERRFWSAVETSLRTQSVVKTSRSGASGQQDINMQRIYLSGERLIHVDYLTEVNNPAQSFNLTISTEAQQYYDGSNYIRYTDYESSEGTSLGEYIDQWAVQETPSENLENYQQQYASGLVSVIPIANLNSSVRAEVLSKLKEAYTVQANNALTQDGVVQIPVIISLRPYLEALNIALTASGYPDLGLDPASAGEGTLSASVEIRTKDSVITKVAYGTIVEEYSNYGVVVRPEEPTTDVTYQELQQAVQQRLSPESN